MAPVRRRRSAASVSGRRPLPLKLFLVLVTAVAFITIDARTAARTNASSFDTVRGVSADVLDPVRRFGNWLFAPARNAWRGITEFDELEDRNAQLALELAQAEASVLRVREIEEDRAALQELLNIREATADITRLTTRVTDALVSNYERTIELAVGARDGVEVGMPVESGLGLVGRVTQVFATRCRVELLTDPNFDAGVRLVRSGDDGLVSGQGSGADLLVTFIDLSTAVIPGESVVTSGFDGSDFPAGMLVGTVTDVQVDPVAGGQRVSVRPAADLDRLRWVAVLLYIVVDRVPPPTAVVPDLVPDAVPDSAPDSVPDAVPDSAPDSVPDSAPDSAPDSVPDSAPDAS